MKQAHCRAERTRFRQDQPGEEPAHKEPGPEGKQAERAAPAADTGQAQEDNTRAAEPSMGPAPVRGRETTA